MRYDISGIAFEWDDNKAERNLIIHNVLFTEAATVFLDPTAIVSPDPDHSEHEERFSMVGYSDDDALVLVSYTTAARANLMRESG